MSLSYAKGRRHTLSTIITIAKQTVSGFLTVDGVPKRQLQYKTQNCGLHLSTLYRFLGKMWVALRSSRPKRNETVNGRVDAPLAETLGVGISTHT